MAKGKPRWELEACGKPRWLVQFALLPTARAGRAAGNPCAAKVPICVAGQRISHDETYHLPPTDGSTAAKLSSRPKASQNLSRLLFLMTAVESVKLAMEKTNGITQPVPLPMQDSFLQLTFQCSPRFFRVVFLSPATGLAPLPFGLLVAYR